MKQIIIFLFCLFVPLTINAEVLSVGNKATYHIKIARTPEELAKGLMFVENLPLNEGMLFDVRSYPEVKMWMKNTYIALDMLFIDCNFRLNYIYKKAKPHSLDIIHGKKSTCYVLEVNGGESQKNGFIVGDEISIKTSD